MKTNDDLQDFAAFMQKRLDASTAFVEGNFKPLKQISVTQDPATIFGPKGDCVQGYANVNAANEKGAASFAPPAKNEFEVMHQDADRNLAYWTGIQRSTVNIKGQDAPVPMALRVTEIFRKENGDWKLMHRHADKLNEEK